MGALHSKDEREAKKFNKEVNDFIKQTFHGAVKCLPDFLGIQSID